MTCYCVTGVRRALGTDCNTGTDLMVEYVLNLFKITGLTMTKD